MPQLFRRIKLIFFILPLIGLLGQLTACSDQQYAHLYDHAVDTQRWLANWQTKRLDVNGIQVAYLDNENTSAKETLVFVHGYTGNKDMWNRLVRHVDSDYRLVAIDLLGHGDTALAPDNRYLLMNQAQLIHGFVQALNISQFHIVGSSMGGATSLLFALHYPQQVKSLTLMNSAGVHSMQASEFEQAIEEGRNPMAIKNIDEFDAMMALIFNQPPWLPEGFKRVMTARSSARYQHYQYVLSEVIHSANIWRESGRIYGLMPKFKKPVLIVWGEDDRVLDASSVTVFKEHLPHAETHILKDTGHVPMLERPQETAAILTGFLTGL